MAITEAPASLLKATGSERTRAGRFFVASRSVNGNGTRTTANQSKVTVSLLVGGSRPLAEGHFQRVEVIQLERLRAPDGGLASGLDLPKQEVTRADS
jgi:hypothetical protein